MLLQQGGGANPALAIAGGILVFVCLILVVALVIAIFFLLTLHRALARCAPENRAMQPGLVWLNLIPCFNIVWQFVTVIKVADSLKNEFESRGLGRDETYGRTLGLTWLVLNLVGSIISNVGSFLTNPALGGGPPPGQGPDFTGLIVSLVSLPFSLGSLVLFIVYWVRIYGYSRELDETSRRWDDDDRPRRRDDYDDDYDDRGRGDDRDRRRDEDGDG